MIICENKQGTPEWLQDRLGVPSASCFKNILTSTGKVSKSRQEYMYELAGERITGERVEIFKTAHMERGHAQEIEARETYEYQNDVTVEEVGFCFPDEYKKFGASPDGLVGENGGLEIKTCLPKIQIKRLEKGWKGTEHKLQVLGCLLVTGREWWDLMSYSPGFKPITIRFTKEDPLIEVLDKELLFFGMELKELVERLMK